MTSYVRRWFHVLRFLIGYRGPTSGKTRTFRVYACIDRLYAIFFSPTSHRFLCKYAITRGNCHFEAIKFLSFCLPFVFPFSREFWSIESKRFKRICTEIKKIVGRARQISISLLLHRNKCKITRGFECVIIEGRREGRRGKKV